MASARLAFEIVDLVAPLVQTLEKDLRTLKLYFVGSHTSKMLQKIAPYLRPKHDIGLITEDPEWKEFLKPKNWAETGIVLAENLGDNIASTLDFLISELGIPPDRIRVCLRLSKAQTKTFILPTYAGIEAELDPRIKTYVLDSHRTRIILNSETIRSIVRTLAGEIDDTYEYQDLSLIGILSGAAYFLVDLSRAMERLHSVHFIQASSYHDLTQGETVKIGGLSAKDIAQLRDRQILVVDELYDNGKTLASIVEYLEYDLGIDPGRIQTCVAFRKDKPSPYPSPDYCGFEALPDVWYIGYGLDDHGTKRNLESLIGVPKPPGIPVSSDEIIFTDEAAYQAVYTKYNLP